jgi:hypothetical protein
VHGTFKSAINIYKSQASNRFLELMAYVQSLRAIRTIGLDLGFDDDRERLDISKLLADQLEARNEGRVIDNRKQVLASTFMLFVSSSFVVELQNASALLTRGKYFHKMTTTTTTMTTSDAIEKSSYSNERISNATHPITFQEYGVRTRIALPLQRQSERAKFDGCDDG